MRIAFKKILTLNKIIPTMFFINFTAIVISSYLSPTTSYEASIYSSTPVITIFLIIVNIFLTTIFCLLSIFKYGSTKYVYILPLLNLFQLLSLYILRGYYSWNFLGDPPTHIYLSDVITQEGTVHWNDIYPVLHILASELYQISSIDLFLIIKLLPLFLSLLMPIGIYLLAKFFYSKEVGYIAFLFSCIPIYGWYIDFTPNHIVNLIFPLILYVIIANKNNFGWKIMTLIFLFVMPLFHPVATLALILVLIGCRISTHKSSTYSYYILLLFTIFILWITYFYVWGATIAEIYQLLVEGGETNYSVLVDRAEYAEGYGVNPYYYGFITQFSSIVFLIPTIFFLGYKAVKGIRVKTNFNSMESSLILVLVAIFIFFILNIGFGPLRLLVYGLICSVVIFSGLLFNYINKRGSSSVKMFIVILILFLFLSINSFLILYPSPLVLNGSLQTTSMEVSGTHWFLDEQNSGFDISTISVELYRMEYILTPSEINYHDVMKAPYNFNLEAIQNDTYLLITERDRSIYEDVFPNLSGIRWSTEDFQKINVEDRMNMVYSSGNYYNVYLIYGC